jgi:hypothetical protein
VPEHNPQPEPFPEPKTGAEEYANLPSFERIRGDEIGSMLSSFVTLTDRYGSLISRIVWALGDQEPQSDQDRVLRDLMADTFDFLNEWRSAAVKGKVTVAYPLARRAYESLSLAAACVQDADVARRWNVGAEIKNLEIRRLLEKGDFAENGDDLRDLYRFFSKAAHPNRDLVARRLLGEGNQYVLGLIGKPDLVLVALHCMHLVQMWFWFTAVMAYAYLKILDQRDPTFRVEYRAVSEEVPGLMSWLKHERAELIAEAKRIDEGLAP